MIRPTILVTGGAGFIGSHTCKALARAGYQPVVYDDPSNGLVDAAGVHWWLVGWPIPPSWWPTRTWTDLGWQPRFPDIANHIRHAAGKQIDIMMISVIDLLADAVLYPALVDTTRNPRIVPFKIQKSFF